MQTLWLRSVTAVDGVDCSHCQHLVGKVGSDGGDIVYHIAVRWLNRNAMLRRSLHVRKETVTFAMQKWKSV